MRHQHVVLTTVSNYRRRAVTLGDGRPSDIVSKIRQIILHSEHPDAVHFMRGIAAIRQALAK